MTFSHTYINIQRKSNYKIDLHSIIEKTRITPKCIKLMIQSNKEKMEIP